MTAPTLTTPDIENAHRYVISDEELEAAAEESALSYTYQTWAYQMCQRFGYEVRFTPIGPEDGSVGSPTQMGIFARQ
jgi:hypothetical protein